MAVDYKGKKPSRFWYFRQRCGAIGQAFKDRGMRFQARAMRRDALLSGGTAGAGVAILTVKYAAMIPLLTTFGAPVAGVAAVIFGTKAFFGFKSVNKSLFVYNEMRRREEKWLEKKSRPKLVKRVGASVGRGFAATGRVLAKPFGIFKRKKSADTAMDAAMTGPVQKAQPLPSAAKDFEQAALKTPEQLALEAQRAEAARIRAEDRARRKKQGGTRFK